MVLRMCTAPWSTLEHELLFWVLMVYVFLYGETPRSTLEHELLYWVLIVSIRRYSMVHTWTRVTVLSVMVSVILYVDTPRSTLEHELLFWVLMVYVFLYGESLGSTLAHKSLYRMLMVYCVYIGRYSVVFSVDVFSLLFFLTHSRPFGLRFIASFGQERTALGAALAPNQKGNRFQKYVRVHLFWQKFTKQQIFFRYICFWFRLNYPKVIFYDLFGNIFPQ